MTDWYYERGGQPQGPVSEEQLGRLLEAGAIDESTLVWHDGQKDWQPYGGVAAADDGTEPVPPPPPPAPPGTAGVSDPEAAPSSPPAYGSCSVCGNVVLRSELIELAGNAVCSRCKPETVQRLKEGAQVVGQHEFAGFWIRFAAVFIDGLVMTVVNLLLYIPFVLFSFALDPETAEAPPAGFWVLYSGTLLAQFVINAGYEIWFIGRFGATPGKLVCRLRVVQPDGGTISYARSTGRYFAKILSGLILLIGYLIAIFDEEKRTLHDHICNTLVIRRWA